MPELTRLRREIRGSTEVVHLDAQSLLDTLDGVYEDLEQHERSLIGPNGQLDEAALGRTVTVQLKQLIEMLCEMDGFGTHRVLKEVLDRLGWDTVIGEADAYKKEAERIREQNSLGDLDDHPF